jgi:hypothetical protein
VNPAARGDEAEGQGRKPSFGAPTAPSSAAVVSTSSLRLGHTRASPHTGIGGRLDRSDHGFLLRERHANGAEHQHKSDAAPSNRGDVRTAQAIGLPGVHNAPCRSVSASRHESRVLTQARGAEPYRGLLRVGAQSGLCWSTGREEGSSLLVHPWPVDALWLMSTPQFRSPQGCWALGSTCGVVH